MIMFITVVALLFILDFTALRWGFDRRDAMDSSEWQRRAILEFPSHRA